MLESPDPPQRQYAGPSSFPEVLGLIRHINVLNPNELPLETLEFSPTGAASADKLRVMYRELLREADKPGFIVIDLNWDARSQYTLEMLADLQLLRSLARTWHAEARTAAAAGEFDRGADYSIANMQIGAMMARGGLQTHALVGIALEAIGRHQLHATHLDISVAKAREILAELLRLEQQREPIQVTAAREVAWRYQTYGWLPRFQFALSKLAGTEYQPVAMVFLGSIPRREAMTRMLICELAIRLFEHDHQRLPQSLEELVPTYLPSVPVDSYSGRPLTYRVQDGKPVLYSVGGDGVDDGGTFGRYGQALFEEGFDFDLDTSNR
jgi:hypothetical protein